MVLWCRLHRQSIYEHVARGRQHGQASRDVPDSEAQEGRRGWDRGGNDSIDQAVRLTSSGDVNKWEIRTDIIFDLAMGKS